MSTVSRKVKDLMVGKEKLITLNADASISDAAKVMEENNVGSVLIVEEGKLKGIFTERDIVRAIAKDIPVTEKLGNIMTTDIITVYEDDYLSKAVYIVSEKGIRHLPVTDKEGNLVGIISAKDLAKYYSEYIEAFE